MHPGRLKLQVSWVEKYIECWRSKVEQSLEEERETLQLWTCCTAVCPRQIPSNAALADTEALQSGSNIGHKQNHFPSTPLLQMPGMIKLLSVCAERVMASWTFPSANWKVLRAL